MSDGTIKYPFYRNGGKYRKTGLKNKRSAHWSRLRKEEAEEKERKTREEERRNSEWKNQFESQWDNFQDYP